MAPPPTRESQVTLKSGLKLIVPGGYRDTRSLGSGLFQEDEAELLQAILRRGMNFADVGAYVGYFTLLASQAVGASGQVFAFEPEPLAFSYLTQNLAINQLGNVVAINKAAADTSGMAQLVRDPRGPESFVTQDANSRDSMTIEAIRLDDFFRQLGWPRIDVMKMNIEGGEWAAIRGMTQLIERNPQLKLVMEFNPAALSRAGVPRDQLERTLRDFGFRSSRVVEKGIKARAPGELLPKGPAVCNLLLSKA